MPHNESLNVNWVLAQTIASLELREGEERRGVELGLAGS